MSASYDRKSTDFYLTDVTNRAIRYWWLIALLMIIGGVAGTLISLIVKPVYESNAIITTVIDYAYAGRLTDYEEDHLLTAIGDIITSDAVMNQVFQASAGGDLALDTDEIRVGLTASRQGYHWELSSRFNDPLDAQAVNRLWLNAALQQLLVFRSESIKALAELNAQVGIENCFAQSVVLDPAAPFCNTQELEILRQHLEGFGDGAITTDLLSRLLASRISFEVTGEPGLPSHPIHLGRNLSTLAGAVIGLLLSLTILVTGYPRSKSPGSSR